MQATVRPRAAGSVIGKVIGMPQRRKVLAAGMAGVFGALSWPGRTAQASVPHMRLDQLKLVNLSHVNDPATTNVFPGDPAFTLETIATIPDDGYFLQFVREGEHTGTHWGAPGHFNEGALLADQMEPADLFLPAVKIDIRDKAAAQRRLRRDDRRHQGVGAPARPDPRTARWSCCGPAGSRAGAPPRSRTSTRTACPTSPASRSRRCSG